MSPVTKEKVQSFLANEYKRLSSRKFQVWLVATGIYVGALGVYLRTMTRCVWKYYDVLLALQKDQAVPVEATGSVQIFTTFMVTMSWGYLFVCLLYCASNIVDKVVAWKFGPDAAPATPPHDAPQPPAAPAQ